MKLFKPVFLVLFSLLLIQCSKSSTNDDNPTPTQNVDKSANLKVTGSSASDILGNANFDEILIEAAYVKGFKPSPLSMSAFQNFLFERTFKQNITIKYLELESPNEEELSLQEIADLEEENRTAYNNDKTLAIYIYFANAPSDEDEEEEDIVTLGAVYRNTSMVIYESTIKKLAAGSISISNAAIESATLNHEFGHLFGLVNLGTTPVNDHEDPDAENHCNVQGCLMRAELQFGGSVGKNSTSTHKNAIVSACTLSGQSVLKMLEHSAAKGAAAVDLDAQCILDLQSNGGR